MRKSLASRPLIYNTKTKKDKQGIKTQKNEREREQLFVQALAKLELISSSRLT